MSAAICILDDHPGPAERLRRVSSRKALVSALNHPTHHQVWVLRSQQTIVDLIRAMAAAKPKVRRARLITYARPQGSAVQVIESAFGRTLLGVSKMVGFDDLTEVLRTTHPEDYAVAAEWDGMANTIAVWRGDLSVLVVPVSAFPPRAGIAPDPSRLSILDSGQTLRMGVYEVSMDGLLYERDPAYRRRARKRMIREEKSLGASIRRLRLLRGVRRSDFPGLDAKTLARIERGDVGRPQRATLEVIAKRLRVTVESLEEY
jgi:hypothetical protein